MDGLTIMIIIASAILVFAVAEAMRLVAIEIIEGIQERRRRCRRRRGYRRGSTVVRSTVKWHDMR